MALRKHGEGQIVPEAEDVKKTAAKADDTSRDERLAALNDENEKTDQ